VHTAYSYLPDLHCASDYTSTFSENKISYIVLHQQYTASLNVLQIREYVKWQEQTA